MRIHELGPPRCFARLVSVTLMLSGCAGHVDLQQLTDTPDELQALHQFKAEHPDVTSEDDLKTALEAYRAATLRKRALAIQFRHRYPNATAEEVNILVDDQMTREGPYPAATPMDCTNTSAVPLTNTNCN